MPIEKGTHPHLPRYRSHKVVQAAPILGGHLTGVPGTANDEPHVVLDLGGGSIAAVPVPQSFFGRGIPERDDMYVLYPDDYQSWSPRAAFVEGYSLCNDDAERIIGEGLVQAAMYREYAMAHAAQWTPVKAIIAIILAAALLAACAVEIASLIHG